MSRSARHKPEWSIAEAKARFSEVVARASAGEPQHVTRYGKHEVVVVSARDWVARGAAPADDHPKATLYDVFKPLIGSGVIF